MQTSELNQICREIRRDILTMTNAAGSGHPGGSLSCVEIMVELYFDEMRLKPEEPQWPGRDRFILSKGHVAPALYSVMARRGFFPVEELVTLRKLGSRLQGHPSMKSLPGLENSSGSLGQGLSICNGMALAAKFDGKDTRHFCLMGDGEQQEGQVWEAAMSAGHYHLDNVCAIIDYNGLQIDGTTDEVMTIDPIGDKYRAFNWHVIEVDGHDIDGLKRAFAQARATKGHPTAVIARTVKGKGVSFMENAAGWHGKAPNDSELEKALAEINEGGDR